MDSGGLERTLPPNQFRGNWFQSTTVWRSRGAACLGACGCGSHHHASQSFRCLEPLHGRNLSWRVQQSLQESPRNRTQNHHRASTVTIGSDHRCKDTNVWKEAPSQPPRWVLHVKGAVRVTGSGLATRPRYTSTILNVLADSEPSPSAAGNEQAATPVPAEQDPTDRSGSSSVSAAWHRQRAAPGRAGPASSVLPTGPSHAPVAIIGVGNGPSNFSGPFPGTETGRERLLGPMTVTAAHGPLKWGSGDGLRSRNTCPAAPQTRFTEDGRKWSREPGERPGPGGDGVGKRGETRKKKRVGDRTVGVTTE